MSFQLLQLQTFECSVCRQLWSEENVNEDTQKAKLFGAVAYAFCPNCHQAVDKKLIRNRTYRARVRKYHASQKPTALPD